MEVSNNWNRLQTGKGIAQPTTNLETKTRIFTIHSINCILIALEIVTERLSVPDLGGMVCVKKTKGRLDCSQPSIFSSFYSIFERADIIARRLDASAKRKP